MRILAIETSCDETGIALVEGVKNGNAFTFHVHKNALLSQAKLHAEFGGVYPNLAKREHAKNLPALFEQFKDETFDAIAVTQGPGLEPALWEGIVFAQKLAAERKLPLLPVNHMEGHLISSLVQGGELKDVQLPVLALLISGGHTEFVVMKDWFTYEVIGETLDDAVGEAYDKVARMLGLGYPGGPEISKLASAARVKQAGVRTPEETEPPAKQVIGSEGVRAEATPRRDLVSRNLELPRPMINTNNCDVSFSGLKTAALYALRDRGGIQNLSAEEITNFAREFEDAVTDVLVEKARRALAETGAKTFVIGGGVAANTHIRNSLKQLIEKDFNDVDFCLPELSITGDNAIMIAEAALARALSGLDDVAKGEVRAVGSLALGQKVL